MKTAVCSGSFDPITLGHLDIIRRAAACFDRVYVCVVPNAEKTNPMFTPEQKLQMVRAAVLQMEKDKKAEAVGIAAGAGAAGVAIGGKAVAAIVAPIALAPIVGIGVAIPLAKKFTLNAKIEKQMYSCATMKFYLEELNKFLGLK